MITLLNKAKKAKKYAHKYFFAFLLICFVVVLAGCQKQQNVQEEMTSEVSHEEFQVPNGWVEYEGEWYAPKTALDTMLVIGIDQMGPVKDSESYNNSTQADFLVLVVFDTEREEISLLQINRDTMVDLPVYGIRGEYIGTQLQQIALSHTWGSGLHDSCINTVMAVSDYLNQTRINHYISINMGAIPQLNDLLGGVTVTVEDDFSDIDPTLVKGQTITLNGQQAMNFLRTRKDVGDSSNLNRMNRHRQYLSAAWEQAQKVKDNQQWKAEDMLSLSSYILTDCSINKLSEMSESYSDYSFVGIHVIDGEARLGDEFMEFYADPKSLNDEIIALFYEKQDLSNFPLTK